MKSFQSSLIKLIILGLSLAALGFGGWYVFGLLMGSGNEGPEYRTDKVERKHLLATISSTGTLQPEEVIDIGAQVVGMIKYFGRDPGDNSAPVAVASAMGHLMAASAQPSPGALFMATVAQSPPRIVMPAPTVRSNATGAARGQGRAIPVRTTTDIVPLPALALGGVTSQGFKLIDYNSAVEEGTVLAQLDDTKYRAAVAQALANKQQGESNLARSRITFEQNDQLLYRLRKSNGAVAKQDIDTAENNVRDAAGAIGVAQSGIAAAEAALKSAQTDLDFTIIRSPTKGVIVDRRVNVGQTVVANLSAPSLFLLAKDLTRMQIWVQVNEADIGHIQVGQVVTFTVDTFPNDEFRGVVSQKRLNAQMTQNVVTFPVVVDTLNVDKNDPTGKKVGKLMPFMTATLKFEVAERENVLTVPNAALRYRPAMSRVHPDVRAEYEKAEAKRAAKARQQATAPPTEGEEKTKHPHATVWIEDGGYLRPIRVATGLTDNVRTEVIEVLHGAKLPEDANVVIGEVQKQGAGGTVNPFAPGPIFGKKKN